MSFDPKRRLLLSRNDVKIAGVCGGIAEYLEIDPTIVRVVYTALTLFSAAFPGIILYILLMLIIPKAQ